MLNALIVIRKCISVTDKKLLKIYTKIWEKISNLMNSEPVYGDKYIKTRLKIYRDKVYQNNIKTIQNYVICILTALLFILKLKILIKILQMMLKRDMIDQIMKLIDHYQKK